MLEIPRDRVERVEEALRRGVAYLEGLQAPGSGAFDLGFDGGALPTAHYIVFRHLLGLRDDETVTTRLVRRLLDRQMAEGGWALAPGLSGHPSSTIDAYVALRASGMDAAERPLVRARRFIVESGGVDRVCGPTQITLALLGIFPWPETLIPPPELALLPPEAPVSLFRVGALLRLHLLPLIVLRAAEAVIASDLGSAVSRELGAKPCRVPPTRPGPLQGEALAACLSLMVERLDEDGTLGGLLLATGWAALAARVSGLPADHPLVVRPVQGLESFLFEPERRNVHVQVCRPTVRATALAMRALRAGRASPGAIARAHDYLTARVAGTRGDFELLGPVGPVVAWAIKPRSGRFPNLLDTLHVVAAIRGLAGADSQTRPALEWVAAMQRPDGGFPLFDRDASTAPWFKRLPFGLLTHTLTDESSPEVTGLALEASGALRFLGARQVDDAVGFLARSQRGDGLWHGPFSVGFLPATCAVVTGLSRSGSCYPSFSLLQAVLGRAIDGLLRCQRAEGGWGESVESAVRGSYVDLGRCSPSQTASALMALLSASSGVPGPAIERAVDFLLWAQEPDGSWVDEDPTSASLTDVLYLRSPVDGVARPLLALERYLRETGSLPGGA